MPALRRRLTAVLAALLCAACGAREERTPPDLVLVVVDTLRADQLSLYGHDRPTSPALDAWAEGGVVFDTARSTSSWTVPSMAMLLTGRLRSDNRGLIRGGVPNLAEVLKDGGYATAAVVANKLLEPSRGWGDGFDLFDYDHDRVARERATGRRGTEDAWLGDEVVERGLALYDQLPEDRPRFLLLMLFDPHQPLRPVAPRFRPRDDGERRARFDESLEPDERLTDLQYAELERLRALYEDEVRQADRAFADLLAGLAQRGRFENTVVAFTADHGEGLWDRAAPPDTRGRATGPLAALYGSHGVQLHEEQVRVPLVLAGPGVPRGERRDVPVSTVDVAPTLAALAGVAVPDADGLDLLRDDLGRRRELVAYMSRGSTLTVDGRWRVHVPSDRQRDVYGVQPVLYDLANDPRERAPVDDPERMEAMMARLAELSIQYDGSAAASAEVADPDLLERLGYVDGQAEDR